MPFIKIGGNKGLLFAEKIAELRERRTKEEPMEEVKHEQIAAAITGMLASGDAELQQIGQADLERYWHFHWDDTATLERNIYEFHDMLELYGSFCRRWEEKHNGTCCVVERVRDTYLMPKIREFADRMRAAHTIDRIGPELSRLVPEAERQLKVSGDL